MPDSWTFALAVGNASAVYESPDTIHVGEKTLMKLTVTGTIDRIYAAAPPNASYQPGSPYYPLDADAEWLGSDRSGFVYASFTGASLPYMLRSIRTTVYPENPNTAYYHGVDSFSVTGLVEGTGRVGRAAFKQPSNPAPPTCNGQTGIQCVVAAGGQQSATLEVTNDWLQLSAQPIAVVDGDAVAFTAMRKSGLSQSLPFTIRKWEWVPDSSVVGHTSTEDCPDGAVSSSAVATCVTRVYESGTMHVWAWMGTGSSARLERAQVRVQASAPQYPPVVCPTGDSLLDDPAARALLRALSDSTRLKSPSVEWAGLVFRLPNGRTRMVADWGASSNTCFRSDVPSALAQAFIAEGWILLAIGHSHPGAPNLPVCVGSGGPTRIAQSGPHGGLHSPWDWNSSDNSGASMLIVDDSSVAIGRARVGVVLDSFTFESNAAGGLDSLRIPSAQQFQLLYNDYPRQPGGQCIRP